MLRAPVKAGEIEVKSQKKTAFNGKIEGRLFPAFRLGPSLRLSELSAERIEGFLEALADAGEDRRVPQRIA
ncbi:MAG: hypothetical protein K2Q17_14140, partial [Nitrospiraceae bacterium]|nr:hypothetical protein [Nitrospiraceae bacterium]